MKSDIIQTKIRAEMYVHVYSVYTVALKKWSLVQYAVCIVWYVFGESSVILQ